MTLKDLLVLLGHTRIADDQSFCQFCPDALNLSEESLIRNHSIMTSSDGNIFRVTGPLCGEFTGDRWFPSQRPMTRIFDVLWTNNSVNNRDVEYLRRHRAHYDVTVMVISVDFCIVDSHLVTPNKYMKCVRFEVDQTMKFRGP